jgi:hypothetical protein
MTIAIWLLWQSTRSQEGDGDCEEAIRVAISSWLMPIESLIWNGYIAWVSISIDMVEVLSFLQSGVS